MERRRERKEASYLRAALWPRRAQKESLHHSPATMLLMLCSRPGTLHDFHSHEIAEQLTLLDAELFYKIEVCVEVPCKRKQLSAWTLLLTVPKESTPSPPQTGNTAGCSAICSVSTQIPEVLLWAKEQNEEKSPNLTQFTEHFNNMSYW